MRSDFKSPELRYCAGTFFLTLGVIMFFDRSMFVLLYPTALEIGH